jgi:carboxylate-amine ligase
LEATVRVFEDVGRIFDRSEDLTIGIEEEFQILDQESLNMVNRFGDLKSVADERFGEPLLAGELIQSEAEINSAVCADFSEARVDMTRRREVLIASAESIGLAVCATGVHPFSRWEDQTFIQTPHYLTVVEDLQYVAWTNNTFGLHVHVGVHGADRAVALSDSFRSLLPPLLALSASSPFLRGRPTGLHSSRAQVFIQNFPRCGIPDSYGDWAGYADYAQFLYDTGCITEPTQIWWSVRTHHNYGTLEVRIADGQPRLEETFAIAGLIVGLVAESMARLDRGEALAVHGGRFIEENRWRALRYGLDGTLIDLDRRLEVPTADVVRSLVDRVEPLAGSLGIERELSGVERMLETGNSAQRQLRMLDEGAEIEDIHRATVAETMGVGHLQ